MSEPREERRSASRGRVKIAVELLHERLKDAVTQTYNYSENGVLVENMPGTGILSPGMRIDIKVTGIMGLPTKVVSAHVVRISDEGIALEFEVPFSTD